MGSNLTTTSTVFRGLLVPDHRITADSIWAAESDYDTASCVAGLPEAQQDTDMVLQATGSQSDGGSLDIVAKRAGFPGPDGATFIWKNTADTEYRGWDPPHTISSWEAIEWNDSGTFEPKYPHLVKLADDQLLVVYSVYNGATQTVRTRRRSTSGTWASAVTVETDAGASGDLISPCLLVQPSGRILCFHFNHDGTNDLVNVRMWYSDDDGDNWTLGQNGCLVEDIDATGYTVSKVRVAYSNGQYLLVVAMEDIDTPPAYPLKLAQYASNDGVKFNLVDVSDGTTAAEEGADPDICVAGGRFIVSLTRNTSLGKSRTIANAYSSIFNATEVAGDIVAGSSLCVDDDGTVYAVGPSSVARSIDLGESWVGFGVYFTGATFTLWYYSDGTSIVCNVSAVCQRGRVVVVHNWNSDAGAADDSLGCAYLGGYTNVCMPGRSEYDSVLGRAYFWRTYLPFDLPSDNGWTATPTGAPVAALTSGVLRITNDAGETLEYSQTPLSVTAQGGMICRFVVAQNGSGMGYVRLRYDAGATDYEAEVRVTSGTVKLWDVAGAAELLTVNRSNNLGVEILFALKGDAARVWYRAPSTTEDKIWTELGQGNVTGAASTANRVLFGATNTSAGAGDRTDFKEFHYGESTSIGIRNLIEDDFTAPDDLYGRTFSTSPTYVEDGVSIAAVDGPAFVGDEWVIAARSEFAVTNIIPSVAPSPRRPWRSSSTAADTLIAWDLDADTTTPEGSFFGNTIYGCYLEGINFAGVALQTSPDGVTWSGSNRDLRTSAAYSAKGNAVRFTSSASAPYVQRNELVGGHFQYASGQIRKIIANTEGTLNAQDVSRGAVIHVEGASGAETETGTGYIWPARVLIIGYAVGGADTLRGIRLSIRPSSATPAPPEGYFQIGTAVIGPISIFGTQYGRGRRLSIEPNVTVTTASDGSRRSRVRGPSRKVVQIAWPDAVDGTSVTMGSVSPDWYGDGLTDDPLAIALRHDTPQMLAGLLEQIDGPHLPVVYCPFINHQTSANSFGLVYTLQHAAGAIYGRITSSVELESALGDEQQSEAFRVGSITIEEEV